MHYLISICAIALFAMLLLFAYKTYAPFGGKSDKKEWKKSDNFKKSVFVNQIPTSMDLSAREIFSIIRERSKKGAFRQPKTPIKSIPIDLEAFMSATKPQVLWLGHSTVLIRVDGVTILTDPIFGKRASPFTFAGPKRTISEMPLRVSQLPPIDVVLISHDHYDHLDHASIRQLAQKTKKFFVPLGVAAHLQRWDIERENIEELDWWKSTEYGDMRLTCTPSRHFSGRTLSDRFKTLWCSWVIDSPGAKLYFSGDTGYGPHFKDIGQKHGPFDMTLMECGQYDKRWPNVHMMPEETVAAHRDLRGKKLLPIHWGAFALALHDWRDSVRRATEAGKKEGVTVVTPALGEVVAVKGDTAHAEAHMWWKKE